MGCIRALPGTGRECIRALAEERVTAARKGAPGRLCPSVSGGGIASDLFQREGPGGLAVGLGGRWSGASCEVVEEEGGVLLFARGVETLRHQLTKRARGVRPVLINVCEGGGGSWCATEAGRRKRGAGAQGLMQWPPGSEGAGPAVSCFPGRARTCPGPRDARASSCETRATLSCGAARARSTSLETLAAATGRSMRSVPSRALTKQRRRPGERTRGRSAPPSLGSVAWSRENAMNFRSSVDGTRPSSTTSHQKRRKRGLTRDGCGGAVCSPSPPALPAASPATPPATAAAASAAALRLALRCLDVVLPFVGVTSLTPVVPLMSGASVAAAGVLAVALVVGS